MFDHSRELSMRVVIRDRNGLETEYFYPRIVDFKGDHKYKYEKEFQEEFVEGKLHFRTKHGLVGDDYHFTSTTRTLNQIDWDSQSEETQRDGMIDERSKAEQLAQEYVDRWYPEEHWSRQQRNIVMNTFIEAFDMGADTCLY